MNRSYLSGIFLSAAVILIGVFFIGHASIVSGATNHVVISQIQTAGTNGAEDEFVELYNPTANDVDLSNWKLTKKTQSGATEENLVASLSGTIKAHGYFLITSQTSSSSDSADFEYSTGNSIADNNSVVLYDSSQSNVDLVGMGTATASEGAAFTSNPPSGQSIVRKANAASDVTSMTTGADQFAGNGEDTNNNANDFLLFTTPIGPRNSKSPIEPPFVTGTPTVTPSTTPSVTPSVSPSVTPSETPSVTPSETPSVTPSMTPSVTPSSTPSVTPSVTPSMTPSVSPSATPSISPTPSMSPTPSPIVIHIPTFHVACTTHVISFHVLTFSVQFPLVTCNLVTNE